MYMYPDNLKGKATLWLWYLRDIGIVRCGGNHWSDWPFLMPIFICQWHQQGAMLFLTIRMADTSIFDFLSYAFAFFIFSQQLYKWHFTGEIKNTLEYRKQEKEMEAMMKRKKKTEKKDTVKKKTKKNKKVSSTRMLINTKTITDYSLKLFNGEEVVFFVCSATKSFQFMSKENNKVQKIFALTNVVKKD